MRGTVDEILMQTHSGLLLDPAQLEPRDLRLEDIAHALALTNRYGGHSPFPWSVAQHSLLVAALLPEEQALWGLLHDAAEAYVGDMIAPLKVRLAPYRSIDDHVMRQVATAYNLPWPAPPEVHEADLTVGAAECRAFGIPINNGREAADVPQLPIFEQPWRSVKLAFCAEFQRLVHGRWPFCVQRGDLNG